MKILRGLDAFRHRDARFLLSGQALSRLGDGAVAVTTVLLIIDRWPGATHLSAFSAVSSLALVASLLFGGVVVDRFRRRELLLASDFTRAIMMAGLAVLTATNHLAFWHLLVVAIFFNAFDSVFLPAMTAFLPEILPEDSLNSANAARSMISSLCGQMAGPALGGVLAIWNPSASYALNALTFAWSGWCISRIKKSSGTRRSSEQRSSVVTEIREGVSYTVKNKWLLWCLLDAGFINAILFAPFGVLVPLFLRQDLHASKAQVALSFTVSGVGWLLGSLVVGSLRTPRRRLHWITISWLIAASVIALISVVEHVWMVYLIGLSIGPLLAYGNVMWESMMQTVVPKDLLGRVTSVDMFLSFGLSPIGVALAGIIVTAIGVRSYFLIAFCVGLPFQAALVFSRTVRNAQTHQLVPQ